MVLIILKRKDLLTIDLKSKQKDFEKGLEEYKAKKKKAVEEIGQDIADICSDMALNCCGSTPCYACIAKRLERKGYRKIPEKEVVLTEEEYEELKKFIQFDCADLKVLKKALNIDFSNVVTLTKKEYVALLDSGGWHDGYCTAVAEDEKKIRGFKEKLLKEKHDYAEWCIKKARKETAEKFAEHVKMAFYYEFDELIPSIMADKIDEIAKELTKGNV